MGDAASADATPYSHPHTCVCLMHLARPYGCALLRGMPAVHVYNMPCQLSMCTTLAMPCHAMPCTATPQSGCCLARLQAGLRWH